MRSHASIYTDLGIRNLAETILDSQTVCPTTCASREKRNWDVNWLCSAVLSATVTNHADHAAAVGLVQHRFDHIPVLLCERESKDTLIVVWMLGNTQPSAWKKEK